MVVCNKHDLIRMQHSTVKIAIQSYLWRSCKNPLVMNLGMQKATSQEGVVLLVVCGAASLHFPDGGKL